MKMKILVGSLALALSGSVFAVDDNDDTQSVTMTIAEVALLNVAAGPTVITATAPTVAGENFTFADAVTTYAISANNPILEPGSTATTRSITAAISAIDPALDITISTDGSTGTEGEATFTSTALTAQSIATAIGNVATTANNINFVVTTPDDNVMPAFGNHTIVVTYTLGASG